MIDTTSRPCGGGNGCDLTYNHTHAIEPGSKEEFDRAARVLQDLALEIKHHEQSAAFHKRRVDELRGDTAMVIERRQAICPGHVDAGGMFMFTCIHCGLTNY